MQRETLSNIRTTVIDFFNKSVEKIGKSVGFEQRKSKLNTKNFCHIFFTACLSDTAPSLESMCTLAKEKKISITKQGFHQRFSHKTTLLMQELFKQGLQSFTSNRHHVFDLLSRFTSVNMIDGSSVSLPANLKEIFKGCGGKASEAGLKLQTYFDYVNGQIKQVTITSGNENDQKFDAHLDQIEKGSLHLQDLGYFKINSFAKINKKNAYFISRFFQKTALYDNQNKPISLLEELREYQGDLHCKEVFFNIKNKFTMRLVAFRLPDAEVEKRIRKIKSNAATKGRAVSQETLEFSKWSIFITNVPKKILNDDQIYLLYSIRWQIELFYKLCKSEAGIDKIRGKKIDRVLCEIYAKLICITALLFVSSFLRWHQTTEISFQKAYKRFKSRALDFFRALDSKYCLLKFVENLLNDFKHFACKDRHRKKRRLACQKLMDSANQALLGGAINA